MKFLSALFVVSIGLVEAHNLRTEEVQVRSHESKTRRAEEIIARNLMEAAKDPHPERRLNAGLINEVFKAALPAINDALQGAIEDPITIDQETTQTYTADVCTGDIVTTLSVDDIAGQSTTEITLLEVVEGTDEYDCNSGEFSADMNFVMTTDMYELTGDGTFVPADAGCLAVSSAYTGTVDEPQFDGVIYIEGVIDTCGDDSVSVKNATLKSIETTCESTSVDFEQDLSSAYGSSFEADIAAALGTEFCSIVGDAIELALSTALEAALADQESSFSPGLGQSFLTKVWQLVAAP